MGKDGKDAPLGNNREVLIETITQCQPYIGFPRILNAINTILDMFATSYLIINSIII